MPAAPLRFFSYSALGRKPSAKTRIESVSSDSRQLVETSLSRLGLKWSSGFSISGFSETFDYSVKVSDSVYLIAIDGRELFLPFDESEDARLGRDYSQLKAANLTAEATLQGYRVIRIRAFPNDWTTSLTEFLTDAFRRSTKIQTTNPEHYSWLF